MLNSLLPQQEWSRVTLNLKTKKPNCALRLLNFLREQWLFTKAWLLFSVRPGTVGASLNIAYKPHCVDLMIDYTESLTSEQQEQRQSCDKHLVLIVGLPTIQPTQEQSQCEIHITFHMSLFSKRSPHLDTHQQDLKRTTDPWLQVSRWCTSK